MDYKDYFKRFESVPEYQRMIMALEKAEQQAAEEHPQVDRLTISEIVETAFIEALKLWKSQLD